MSTATILHPCFGVDGRGKSLRAHLPVAATQCGRIRFSPLAKIGPALTPHEALAMLDRLIEREGMPDMVGITGPGDPLAHPGPTLETLRLVRDKHPDLPLCLTALGIGGADSAAELARLSLSHVTLLKDAMTPGVAAKLYAWIRPGRKTLPLEESVRILLEEQDAALKAFKEQGLTVKINTTVYPTVNDQEVEPIARWAADNGADYINVQPFIPDEQDEVALEAPGSRLMMDLRDRAGRHLPLVSILQGCESRVMCVTELNGKGKDKGSPLPTPTPERPNVAVVSEQGMEIDQHLGHATRFLVYGPRADSDGLVSLLDTRTAPVPGGGDARWEKVADLLSDCFALLAVSAGHNPRRILSSRGILVVTTDADVTDAVDQLFGGGKKGKGSGK